MVLDKKKERLEPPFKTTFVAYRFSKVRTEADDLEINHDSKLHNWKINL